MKYLLLTSIIFLSGCHAEFACHGICKIREKEQIVMIDTSQFNEM